MAGAGPFRRSLHAGVVVPHRDEPLSESPPRRVAATAAGERSRLESPRGRASNRADDPWWLEPYPDALLEDFESGPEARYDARESIALSFVAGLQKLPAGQRSVLVLRDVLGFPASEVADMLGTTPASVNSALIRARGGFRPERAPELVGYPVSAREAAVVDRFVDAFQSGDLNRVIELLGDDARLSMPPEPIQCDGPREVAEYLRQRQFWGPDLQLVPTRANGQPAFGYYLPDPTTSEPRPRGVIVLTISRGHISTLTRFGGPAIITRFGLATRHPTSWFPSTTG